MKKVKGWLRNKYARAGVVAGTVVASLACGASAADEALTTAMTTGFTTMKTDALAMIAVIVPIALSVAGTIFVARKAIGWFKSLAK